MTKIAIFGVTGYTGHYVATEALKRGLEVVGLGRSMPKEPIEGVEYVAGDAFDQADRAKILEGADAVLLTLAPKGPLETKIRDLYATITDEVPEGARLVVAGGWSSLLGPDGTRQVHSWPDPDGRLTAYKQLAGIADDLEARTDNVQWTYITPPNVYGGAVPPQRTVREYRLGGATPLPPHEGDDHTWISGENYAQAIVDLLTSQEHIHEVVNAAA